MARRKGTERLIVTIDAELVSWVNDALAESEARERRLNTVAKAVAAYEAKFGGISAEELAAQLRADGRSAVVVRGRTITSPHPRRPRRTTG
jgi:hypothetical protein